MRFCWAQYLLWLVISIFGAGAMLSACGQKGDLYLPKKAPAGQDVEQKDKPAPAQGQR